MAMIIGIIFTLFVLFFFFQLVSRSLKPSEEAYKQVAGMYFMGMMMKLMIGAFILITFVVGVALLYFRYGHDFGEKEPPSVNVPPRNDREQPAVEAGRRLNVSPTLVETLQVYTLSGDDGKDYFLYQKKGRWLLSTRHPSSKHSKGVHKAESVIFERMSPSNLDIPGEAISEKRIRQLWGENGEKYFLRKRSGEYHLIQVIVNEKENDLDGVIEI